MGWPLKNHDAYKYTPIFSKLADKLNLNQPTTSKLYLKTITLHLFHKLDAYQIILLNGQLLQIDDGLNTFTRLFQVLTFTEAFQKQHPAFIRYDNQYNEAQSDPFAALNTTLFFEEGLLIHMVDPALLDKAKRIHHITDSITAQKLSYPHILITAGKKSHVTIIASWYSIGDHSSFTNAVTRMHVAADALLAYYNLQTHNLKHAYQVNVMHAYQ